VPSLLARRAQTSTRIIEALMMDRRTLLLAFLSGAVTAPVAARAQRARKVYRIGLLGGSSPTAHEASARLWDAFFQGLRELGYVEGQTIVVEGRWYGENTERLPSLAVELVQAKVDVIVAGAPPAPEAAARATSTIPIVMAGHPDPVWERTCGQSGEAWTKRNGVRSAQACAHAISPAGCKHAGRES
jgi:ABC-type uncharacterized transport system substrate-binding protein